jgi:hypothetical protein
MLFCICCCNPGKKKARKSLNWKLCNLLAGNIIIIWLRAASGFAWVSSSRFEQKLWVKMKEEAE